MPELTEPVREALRAFYRLHETTAATAQEPFLDGAEEKLKNAATEANTAMQAAGLLDLPPAELFALVRQLYPHFTP
ncbi:hypothetical protein [Streptomyces sp. BH105]|uniref:hypothetical protein n=1 Tax=Streptomyces sp. BH105 TaxID=3410408 RepID=UPI003CF4EE53